MKTPDGVVAPREGFSARRLMRGHTMDIQTAVTLSVLISMIIVFSQLNSQFFTITNFKNVLIQTAPVILVGCAITPVMIARGLDLSVGSVAAASAVFAAVLTAQHGWSLWLALAGALLLGLAFGLVNGVLTVRLRVSPIIATLGTQNIARGVAYLLSANAILVGLPSNWGVLGTGDIGPVPTPVLLAFAAVIIFHIVLTRTTFGRHVYAIGGNEETARLSGVNVDRTVVILYATAGLMAALGGMVIASNTGSGDPNMAIGFEFDVIVAVILGGTSLSGGEGRIAGTVLGALIVGFLSNSLNLIGVNPFWQYVAEGLVLIFAVILDRIVRTGATGSSNRLRRRRAAAVAAGSGGTRVSA